MTREAKIGLLTGLGVILLIGVLLSNYLGDGKGAMPGAGSLPIGAAYRQQVTEPVIAPGMSPEMEPPTVVAAYATADTGMTGAAVNVKNATPSMASDGPTVSRAVTPIAAGPAPVDATPVGSLPTIALADARPVTAVPTVNDGGAAVETATGHVSYAIAAGDTLLKIAHKYYGSAAGAADVQRIVAANPGVLKDAATMLVVGKKLTITNVPVAAVAPKAAKVVAAKPEGPMMISLPEPADPKMAGKAQAAAGPVAGAKKAAGTKTYVVQAGDTLEKIARKFAPSNSTQLVMKLKAANGIKDPSALQIGTTLKVPV